MHKFQWIAGFHYSFESWNWLHVEHVYVLQQFPADSEHHYQFSSSFVRLAEPFDPSL